MEESPPRIKNASISEKELQRYKQKGGKTTLSDSDQNIMRMPDLKALAYPAPTNMPTELTNEYATEFIPPFGMQQKQNKNSMFAQTGELKAIHETSNYQPEQMYQQMSHELGIPQRVYGANPISFIEKCKMAMFGAIYDLLHQDDINMEFFTYAIYRDGRLPYLVCCILFIYLISKYIASFIHK